jgi:mannose-1-phosphate guanylyltransferase
MNPKSQNLKPKTSPSASPHHFAIILAGGRGERFWPLSRKLTPKQFLPIVGDVTMLQQTYKRIRPLFRPQNILVLTNAQHVGVVRKQLPQIPRENIIGEPVGRDTAPAVALGAAIIGKRDPQAVMALLPADAVIHNVARFRRVLTDALHVAGAQNVLVTIGLKPASPHTGYGYVQAGRKLPTKTKTTFSSALRFTEKPNVATAKRYLRSGDFYWNSGMFVWSFDSIMKAFDKWQPEMAAGCSKIYQAAGTPTFAATLRRVYPKLEKISVDYALMEKADNIVVARGDFDWDDLGTWTALERHFECDHTGSVARGAVEMVDAKNCVVVGDGSRLVAAVGVNDLVIVDTKDVTLVCHKNSAQRVRELVKRLEQTPRRRKHL